MYLRSGMFVPIKQVLVETNFSVTFRLVLWHSWHHNWHDSTDCDVPGVSVYWHKFVAGWPVYNWEPRARHHTHSRAIPVCCTVAYHRYITAFGQPSTNFDQPLEQHQNARNLELSCALTPYHACRKCSLNGVILKICMILINSSSTFSSKLENKTKYIPTQPIYNASVWNDLWQVIINLYCVVSFLSGSLGIVVLSQFYSNSYRRDWMPMPERNSFGYSYWLELTTTALLISAFMMTLIAAVLKVLDMTDEEKDTAYAEDMMLGRR